MPESTVYFTDPPPLLPPWTQSITRYETKRVERARAKAEKRGHTATLTVGEWLTILFDHNFECHFCDGPAETLEHVRPLWAGGNTTADNCKPCCKACNQSRNFVAWGVHYFNKAVDEQSLAIANDLFALITDEAQAMVLEMWGIAP